MTLSAQAQAICRQADQLLEAAAARSENHDLVAEAAELYIQAASLDPEQIGPYLGLAYLMIASGNLDSAQGLLLQARELEPGHPEIAWFEQELSRLETRRVSFEPASKAGSAPIQKLASIRRLGQDSCPKPADRSQFLASGPAALNFGPSSGSEP